MGKIVLGKPNERHDILYLWLEERPDGYVAVCSSDGTCNQTETVFRPNGTKFDMRITHNFRDETR